MPGSQAVSLAGAGSGTSIAGSRGSNPSLPWFHIGEGVKKARYGSGALGRTEVPACQAATACRSKSNSRSVCRIWFQLRTVRDASSF